MTKDYFMENAKPLYCNLTEDIQLKLEPRMFNTGSCGWYAFSFHSFHFLIIGIN